MRFILLLFFFCLYIPAGYAFEATATRSYGGHISVLRAELAARTAARLQAYSLALHELVRHPLIQFVGQHEENTTFTPPSFDGLTHFLYTAKQYSEINNGTVTVIVTLEPNEKNMRDAITKALRKRETLERYSATITMQEEALLAYDRMVKNLLYVSVGESSLEKRTLHKAANRLQALEVYYNMLAYFDGVWGAPKQQLEKLQHALSLDPDNPLLLGAIAELLLQDDKPLQAEQQIVIALALAPNYAFLHDIKGVTLLRKNLPILATASFATAIHLKPQTPVYYMHRASAYLVQGELEYMCEDFRSACTLGECSGYQWAHEQNFCPTKSNSVQIPRPNKHEEQ